MEMKKVITFIVLFSLMSGSASCRQTVGLKPQTVDDLYVPGGDGVRVEVWIQNLEIPWSLIFLAEGRALVSERRGRIRLIQGGTLQQNSYADLDVARSGEGGLMGLAAHPDFPQKPYVYAMHTYERQGNILNRVVRLSDNGTTGSLDRVIIDGIPGGRFHNGGRIAFGPDGMLYITTGETVDADLAQDRKSFGGKILRITPEGLVPGDNPFKDSPVYSYGHRNPQGISWHPETGDLFSSEHGPSGEFGHFAHDEVNRIVKGGNYGWPEVIGAAELKEYIDPIVVWKRTTPPSGITFYHGRLLPHLKNDLFVATLRSESLIRIRLAIEDGLYRVSSIERWFHDGEGEGRYGRIRDVVQGPEGALYILTNNRDGRGVPRSGDDRIIRILSK
jgi:quinoprotein glucose dehydrogenase